MINLEYNKIRLALILSLGLAPLSMLAQVHVSGRVLDENKKPLPYANVRLTAHDGKLIGGQATDNQGLFNLPNIKAGEYTLEVSFTGYQTHKEQLKLHTSTPKFRVKDISLKEGSLLKEVTVTGKATEIILKGDTIEYNAGSFAPAEGAELLELIKKLPGAQVDESGNVKINGKSISQIMVDGKHFFESDPKVALKNLPAELVDKVQVLERESDNSRMTGFSDGSEETVINLTIKPGRKQGLFGTVYAGGGTKNRYEGNGIINRFSDKQQWTIIGGLNNTNNAGFSDIASDLSRSDIAQQASGSARRPWGRDSGNDGITISRILGGNAILSLGTKVQAGGNAFAGNSDKTLETKSETTNIESTGTTQEKSVSVETNNKWNVGTDLRMEWKPDDKTEIIVAPRISMGTGVGHLKSSISTDFTATGATEVSSSTSNHISQDTESRVYDGRLEVDMSRKLSDKGRTLALSLEGSITGNKVWGNYQADASVATLSRNQDLRNEEQGHTLRARVNYVEPLAQGLALQLNYQIRHQYTEGERTAFDNIKSMFDANGSYDLETSFLSQQAGIAFKRFTKTFDVTLGVNVTPSVLRSTTIRTTVGRDIEQKVTNYSPTFRLSYKPSKAFNIRLDYRGRSFQPTVNQLSPINDSTNPLIVYQGNPNLSTGFRHDLFGMMSLFSIKSQAALNLFVHSNLTENNIVSKSEYNPSTGVRTFGYENVDGNWSIGLGGFGSIPLPGKKFSLRLGLNNNYARSVGFVGSERNNADNWTFNEELALAYRFGRLDTSLKGIWSHNKIVNSLSSAANNTATNDYGLHWDTQISLPLDLALESQLRYTSMNGYASGYNYDQTIVNVGLSYSFLKGKIATLRFKVYDLLGEQRNVYRNVSALAISSQETNIIGRYAMLHFIYKFNSFSGNASASDMKNVRRGPGGPPPGRF